MAKTPKHVFDFEGILSMDVNQKNWKDIKKRLDDAFGELRIGIQDGLAAEEAERYVKMFNQVFAKAQLPDIGLDDLRNGFDKVAESFSHALGLINNIDTSALKGIETTLDHISDQVDVIATKVGRGIQQGANGAVASVAKLDAALSKVGDSAKEIEDALNFSNDGGAKKQLNVLKKISDEWKELETNRIEANRAGKDEDIQNWVKRQRVMAKYVRAYEDYVGKLKNKNNANKEYTALYDRLLPKSHDAKTNLQNLLARRAGTYSPNAEPWAREETLKEIKNILSGGISVKDDDRNSGASLRAEIEKERASIKASANKIDDIINKLHKNTAYTMYRGVHGDESDGFEKRSDVYDGEFGYGAEYYIESKRIAGEYAPGDDGDGHVIEAEIRPKNAIVYDAGGKDYKDVVTNSDFIEWFKKQHKDFENLALSTKAEDAEGNQLLMNRAAKSAGFDAIVFDNILDHIVNDSVGEGTAAHTELSRTIAVLSDEILEITGFFDVKDGKISGKKNKNAPEYYYMPETSDGESKSVSDQTEEAKERIALKRELRATQLAQKKAERRVQELEAQLPNASQGTSADSEAAKPVIVDGVATEETLHKILDHLLNNAGGSDLSYDDLIEIQKQILSELRDQTAERGASDDKGKRTIPSQGGTDREKFAYLNTGLGRISQYIEGGYEGVKKSDQEKLLNSIGGSWNSTIHTHPELVAAPSEEDIQNFVNHHNEFKKNFILAGEQLAEIDFSSLTKDQAQLLADTYKKNITDAEDDLADKIGKTPFKELGIESLDVETVLSRTIEKLKEQFPNLIDNITVYTDELRRALQGLDFADLSQFDLEDNISDLVGAGFKGSNKHVQADIYQITKDAIDSVSGVPSMYQRGLQDIFKQTIDSLKFDSSAIFKTHNSDAFFNQMSANADAAVPTLLSEISAKLDKLATDAVINAAKDAIVSAITADQEGRANINTDAFADALKGIQIAQDNNDIITALQGFIDRLGSMVAQDDTLQGVKSALDAIKSSGFNVDISPESITTAIKEALYAKEIAANYEEITFDKAFEKYDDDEYVDQLTGELRTLDEAIREYEQNIKGLWKTKDGEPGDYFIGPKADMLDRIAMSQEQNIPVESEKWAQVIVEAINTQGGKIIETIKLIIPNFADGNELDEYKLVDAFNTFTSAITKFIEGTFQNPRDVMRMLLDGVLDPGDLGITEAMKALTLMSESGKMQFKIASVGGMNEGVAIGEDMVYRAAGRNDVNDIFELMQKQNEAYKLGAAVPRILAAAEEAGRIYQLQTRAPGVNLRAHGFDEGVLNATDEQIDRLIHTLEVLEKVGLHAEFGGDNVMYDKDKGFTMIDLDNEDEYMYSGSTAEEMLDGVINQIVRATLIDYDDDFINRIKERAALNPDQRLFNENIAGANRNAIKSGVRNSSNKARVSNSMPPMDTERQIAILLERMQNGNFSIGTEEDDVSWPDSFFSELANDSSLKESANTASNAISKVVDSIQSIAQISQTVQPVADELNQESSKSLKQQIDDVSTKVSIDAEQLKNVLNSITYNVKVVQDGDMTGNSDTDKIDQLAANMANKVKDWNITQGADALLNDEPLLYEAAATGRFDGIYNMKSLDTQELQQKLGEWMNEFMSPDVQDNIYGKYVQDLINDELAKLQTTQVDDATAKVSVDAEELKNVLNAITYNVKVVQGDDGEDNKIAVDEASLEATLNKVFANILNPPTQQNDSESAQEPWTRESTLQTVKGVLDNIQTNIAKFGTVEISNIDAIAGTTLEGKLTEIKSVLESIDNKIAKGGVIATRGAVKQANAQSAEPTVKEHAARSNMLKSITNDYKTMGKLAAQFASDGNLETKAMLENLKEEINRKRKSLKLTMDENKSLREKYSIAFDAEKRLLEAEKAQEEIDKKKNNDAKDVKTAWKKQVKEAQRATGINAATSIANAGDQTVLRTIGAKDVSDDISQKAKELSDQIKALRAVRDEIDKKGDQASEEDRNNLSKQIASVKTLKSELDGYLKIHEKYSGDDVADLGDASNFGAVGTDEYWNNITAAIKANAEGRAVIKGLNADTGELTGTTKIAANTFATWSATVDPVTGKLSMLRTGIKKTETIIESITRKTKEIFTYFSGSSIIFKAFNELKKGVQYVRDIDLALTELKKVTNETEESYDRFLETAAKTADKVGSTIKDVVSSTADWARLNI